MLYSPSQTEFVFRTVRAFGSWWKYLSKLFVITSCLRLLGTMMGAVKVRVNVVCATLSTLPGQPFVVFALTGGRSRTENITWFSSQSGRCLLHTSLGSRHPHAFLQGVPQDNHQLRRDFWSLDTHLWRWLCDWKEPRSNWNCNGNGADGVDLWASSLPIFTSRKS